MRMSRCRVAQWLCLFGLAIAWLHAGAAQQLLPSDDAARDASFARFRSGLLQVIERRDVAGLRAALSDRIVVSFGQEEPDALVAFEQTWRPAEPNSTLWQTLGAVLRLGGSFDGVGYFNAPYVFTRWPESVDAVEHVAAVAPRVPVHESPAPESRTIAILNFSIVALAEPRMGEPWVAIRLPDGSLGHVESGMVRGPLDYRATFEKIDGHWKMTALVAGD